MKVSPHYDVAAPSVPSSATRIDDAHINLEDTTPIISTSTYVRLSQQPEYSVKIPELPKTLRGGESLNAHIAISCVPDTQVIPGRGSKSNHQIAITQADFAWQRDHVLRDLRPYICTYEDCRDGDQQYDTFRQWVSHEERSHRTARQCTEHAEEIFKSDSEWREHMNDQHREDKQSPQSVTIEQKTPDVVGTRQCPICPGATVTNEHVAIHLQQLALFALPKLTGLEDDTGSINQDSAAMNVESRESGSEELEEICFSDADAHNTKPQMYGIDFNNAGNYLGELDYYQLPPDKWVEGESWHAVFNPNIPRSEDVELVWQADQETIVACVAYSKSGKHMAIGTANSAIIYESQNGKEISKLHHVFSRSDECYVRGLCFDLEEKYLVTGAEDKLVRVSY